jgi:hypothetical protein
MFNIFLSFFGSLFLAKIIYFFFINTAKSDKILIDNLDESNEDIDDDIDAVITWVDSSDKYWQEQRSQYYLKEDKSSDNQNIRFPNPEFVDNELYYCVASINKYLPWIRNIFIVTCFNQKPSWINKFPKIKIIDHTEIIPLKYLPTFNSHVIECHLHKIINLSSKFIYFNDDFYVNKYLKKKFFFYKNQPITFGKIRRLPFYYSNKTINKIYLYLVKKFKCNYKYLIFSINSNYYFLLNKKTIIKSFHVPKPLTIDIMSNLENKFKNEFIKTSQSKFRSPIDLRITYFASNFSDYLSIYNEDDILFYSEFTDKFNLIKNQKFLCFNNLFDECSHIELQNFFKERHNIVKGI